MIFETGCTTLLRVVSKSRGGWGAGVRIYSCTRSEDIIQKNSLDGLNMSVFRGGSQHQIQRPRSSSLSFTEINPSTVSRKPRDFTKAVITGLVQKRVASAESLNSGTSPCNRVQMMLSCAVYGSGVGLRANTGLHMQQCRF
ncbi:hypothetical protein CSUI_005562 [Cystoisospora suis]|uniref:Uncharacterized protein n=1 Tax=Cystoisospora suis TaxID=483139 RepID=A0A2C6KWN9_9APIC|nr:hypothetical protein CSUI_005562 [Cystoisospora suis]